MVFDRSNGIFRSVFAALVGLALVGAAESPKGGTQAEQSQGTTAVKSKTAPANLTAPEKPITTPPDTGCKKGNDKRDSDLCAQWKAADAATDSAYWTWWQFLLGIIGLVLGVFTMGAASAAAYYAKKAADHTKTGADAATAAHDSFVETERAVIRFYSAEFSRDEENSFNLTLKVRNVGKSIAKTKSINWHVINAPIFPQRTHYEEWIIKILTATTDPEKLGSFRVNASVEDLWHGLFFAMGFVEYETIGRVFRSHFCFKLAIMPKDGFRDEYWDSTVGICQDFPADT